MYGKVLELFTKKFDKGEICLVLGDSL